MLKAKRLVRTNIILDRELIDSIDEVAEMMSEDRSTAIRQLIKKAVVEEKISLAVKKFKEGASFRTAAEIAGIDYWDFQAELDKRCVPMLSSLSLAQKRVSRL
jgi:predicted HTH domain antitoxin